MEQPVQPTPEEKDIRDARTWAALAHLSGLITLFIGPLIIWAIYKDRYPFVNDQAKEAMNFQISMMIYYIASSILAILLIGVIGWIVLPILDFIFVIVAAVNASNGTTYRYPITIRLIQ